MPNSPNQPLWPELELPASPSRRGRGRVVADEVPAAVQKGAQASELADARRAPAMFCPHGGLTPWQRDYPTGKALCGRCERRNAEGCVLAGRPVDPDAPANCHTPGLTGLINAVGRW